MYLSMLLLFSRLVYLIISYQKIIIFRYPFLLKIVQKDDECTKSENVMLIRSSSYWYSIGVRSLKYTLLYAHNSIFSDANQTDHTRSQLVNGQNINHLQSSRVCVYIFVFVICVCVVHVQTIVSQGS